MRVRSAEEVADALMDPEEEDPPIREAVKRPTATEYARVKSMTSEERLRRAFALTAWAMTLSQEANHGDHRG